MNTRQYKITIITALSTAILAGALLVTYVLIETNPAWPIIGVCLTAMSFLAGCAALLNALCGTRAGIIFCSGGTTMKAQETSRLLFRFNIAIFFAAAAFFMFMATKTGIQTYKELINV